MNGKERKSKGYYTERGSYCTKQETFVLLCTIPDQPFTILEPLHFQSHKTDVSELHKTPGSTNFEALK